MHDQDFDCHFWFVNDAKKGFLERFPGTLICQDNQASILTNSYTLTLQSFKISYPNTIFVFLKFFETFVNGNEYVWISWKL